MFAIMVQVEGEVCGTREWIVSSKLASFPEAIKEADFCFGKVVKLEDGEEWPPSTREAVYQWTAAEPIIERYAAHIIVWSETGHTPVTNRGGSYCDELANFVVQVKNHKEAVNEALSAMARIKYAARGHVSIPKLPNQNYRSQWLTPACPDPKGC